MKNLVLLALGITTCLLPNLTFGQCEVTGTTAGATCKGQSGTISATPSIGGNILWYTQSVGGSPIGNGNTLNISSINTTTTYYAEAYGGTAVADSINTLTPNNGQVTATFDCIPKKDITVTGFNFVPRSSGTYTVQIYYKQGTHVGSETNSGAWTLLGTSSGISATANNLTYIPAVLSQQLQANQRYAFYIHASSGGTLGYTNGTTLGNTAVQNSDIEILQGRGGSGLFSGSLFTTRTFAGTMRYEVGSVCTSATRTPVVLTVHPEVAVDSQTVTDTTCVSTNTSLFVNANGPVNHYQWQVYNTTTGMFENVSGSNFIPNGNILDVNNIPASLNGARIRVVLDGFCGVDTSAEMMMIVNDLPSVTTNPVDVVADNGDDVTFSIVSAGANVEYQWQVGVNDTFANINNNGIYSGVKTNTLTVRGVSRAQNEYEFRCAVLSRTCMSPGDTSNIAVLYVNPVVSVNEINATNDITVYPNPAKDQINISVDNNEANTYKITDQYGRTIIDKKLNNNRVTTVDISQISSGIYSIMLFSDKGKLLGINKFSKL